MNYMIMYILDHVSQMPRVLHAWEELGAPGITIFNSLGVNRLRQSRFRDDLPLIPSLQDLMNDTNLEHRTLLMIVPDEEAVERYVNAAREVIGDFDQPHTGILCVLPVAQVYGLGRPAHPPK